MKIEHPERNFIDSVSLRCARIFIDGEEGKIKNYNKNVNLKEISDQFPENNIKVAVPTTFAVRIYEYKNNKWEILGWE